MELDGRKNTPRTKITKKPEKMSMERENDEKKGEKSSKTSWYWSGRSFSGIFWKPLLKAAKDHLKDSYKTLVKGLFSGIVLRLSAGKFPPTLLVVVQQPPVGSLELSLWAFSGPFFSGGEDPVRSFQGSLLHTVAKFCTLRGGLSQVAKSVFLAIFKICLFPAIKAFRDGVFCL